MDSAPNPLPIVKPCAESWNEMHGDERRRFCDKCNLHVHNLSAMSARERDHFVQNRQANDCVAYVAVGDNKILVPAEERYPRFLKRAATWALAIFTPIFGVGFTSRRPDGSGERATPPIEVMSEDHKEAPVTAGVPVPGRPAPPKPTPTPKPPKRP